MALMDFLQKQVQKVTDTYVKKAATPAAPRPGKVSTPVSSVPIAGPATVDRTIDFAASVNKAVEEKSQETTMMLARAVTGMGSQPKTWLEQKKADILKVSGFIDTQVKKNQPVAQAAVIDVLKDMTDTTPEEALGGFRDVGLGAAASTVSIGKDFALGLPIALVDQVNLAQQNLSKLLGTDPDGKLEKTPVRNMLQAAYDYISEKEQDILSNVENEDLAAIGGGGAQLLTLVGLANKAGWKAVEPFLKVMAVSQGSQVYQETLAATGNSKKALLTALVSGTGSYYLNKLGLETVVGKAFGKGATNWLTQAIVGAFAESVTETMEQAVTGLAQNVSYGKAMPTLKDYWKTAWISGTVGLFGAGVSSAMSVREDNKALQNLQKEGFTPDQSREVLDRFKQFSDQYIKKTFDSVNGVGENRTIGLKGGQEGTPGIDFPSPLPERDGVPSVTPEETFDQATGSVDSESMTPEAFQVQQEMAQAKVEAINDKLSPFTLKELNSFAELIRIKDLNFSEGDIDSMLKSPGTQKKVSQVLERYREVTGNSQMTDEDAFEAIQNLPKMKDLRLAQQEIKRFNKVTGEPSSAIFDTGGSVNTVPQKMPERTQLAEQTDTSLSTTPQLPTGLVQPSKDDPLSGSSYKQVIPGKEEDVYTQNRKGKKTILGTVETDLKKISKGLKGGIDKYMGVISTRLKNISPKLKFKLRKMEFDIRQHILKRKKAVIPLMEKVKTMNGDDRADFDLARKNGDVEKINEIVKKYNAEKEYEISRNMLDEIYQDMESVGYDVGYKENYFPRTIKDVDGFLEHWYDQDAWPLIQQAIQEKEFNIKRNLTINERASVVDTLLRGYKTGQISLSKTGAMKSRLINEVTPELNQFYMDTDSALVAYIDKTTEAIEARKFFGKSVDTEATAGDSIGAYVLELIQNGDVSASQEVELTNVLNARFNPKGTSGIVDLYKNLEYLGTMGSISSAVTQLGDVAFAAYKGGAIKAGKSFIKAATGSSKITREDLGIERIAAEFTDSTKASKAVSMVFKVVGLDTMDKLGKESLINAVLEKYQSMAKKPSKTEVLKKKLEPIFESETDQALEDLRSGTISENVKLLVFNELLDVQPVALSEMPEQYLKGGNGRIFYMLKSYTLKLFDVYRNDIFQKIGSGNQQETVEGLSNLVRLTAALMIMGATADFLKDLLFNRDIDLDDIVVDNIFKLFGITRYTTWQAREDRIGTAIGKQILFPFSWLDSLYKDANLLFEDPKKLLEEGTETAQRVPVVGKLYYWWLGKGSQKEGDDWRERPVTLEEENDFLLQIRQQVEEGDITEDQADDKMDNFFKRQESLNLIEEWEGLSAKEVEDRLDDLYNAEPAEITAEEARFIQSKF